MQKAHHIAGLDIGSGTLRMVLVEERPDNALAVVGAAALPASGMRKGAVACPEEIAEGIRTLRLEVKKMSGIDIRHAHVGIGDSRLGAHISRGVVAISRADGQIAEDDIRRSVAASEEALPRLQNRHILHHFPMGFRVDGDAPVRDPLGMNGMKIEVETIFVTAFLAHYKNLLEALDAAGITLDDIVVTPLATAELLLSKKQKEIGVLLLDFGAETSSLAVWEETRLLSLEVIPIGSAHITYDIALGFQVSINTAERLKKSYAAIVEGGKKEIRLSGFDKSLEATFSQRRFQDIISARLGDIFELTQKHLKKIGRAGLLPAGVVLTGGGARLPGIIDVAKKELRLPAALGGAAVSFSGKKDLVDGPEWAAALGLAYWGVVREGNEAPAFLRGPAHRRIKRFLKSLVP